MSTTSDEAQPFSKKRGLGKILYHTTSKPKSLLSAAFRYASSFTRTLPNFIIIGAHKGGTSTLYHYICSHPDVVSASQKEVHFFDCENYTKGLNWYRSHFVTQQKLLRYQESYGRPLLTGEATPFYLFHPFVPERAFNLLPNVKLIVLLRNPVDRAYSHYKMNCRRGVEELTFEEAISQEAARLEPFLDVFLKNAGDTSIGFKSDYARYSYLARGLYANQISRWLKFYKRENILALKSEFFFGETDLVMQQVFQFLNLPEIQVDISRKMNVGGYGNSMNPCIKNYLIDYFYLHNIELSKLLQEDFNWN